MTDTLSFVQLKNKHSNDGGVTRTGQTHYLNDLQYPRRMAYQSAGQGIFLDGCLQFEVCFFLQFDIGEKIVDQRDEQGLVFIDLDENVARVYICENCTSNVHEPVSKDSCRAALA